MRTQAYYQALAAVRWNQCYQTALFPVALLVRETLDMLVKASALCFDPGMGWSPFSVLALHGAALHCLT